MQKRATLMRMMLLPSNVPLSREDSMFRLPISSQMVPLISEDDIPFQSKKLFETFGASNLSLPS